MRVTAAPRRLRPSRAQREGLEAVYTKADNRYQYCTRSCTKSCTPWPPQKPEGLTIVEANFEKSLFEYQQVVLQYGLPS